MPRVSMAAAKPQPLPKAPSLLETEREFYGGYGWCLDAFPTLGDVVGHLGQEASRLRSRLAGWPQAEAATNVFLLACALADGVDDDLAGDGYDLSAITAVVPPLRPLTRIVERALGVGRRARALRQRGLRAWRSAWGAALGRYLRAALTDAAVETGVAAAAAAALVDLLDRGLPPRVLARRAKVPAAFRSQDLAPHDLVELAERFAAAFPDRERPLLVLGLRTAGSYFAPVVAAALGRLGYADVEPVTLRPKKGAAPWEQAALARCAARRGLAVVVDEPADTGATVARAVDLLGRAGVPPGDVVVLLPVHPTRRDWDRSHESLPLARTTVITLEPEAWHKHKRLEPDAVGQLMSEYFRAQGYVEAEVVASPSAERFNRQLQRLSEEKFHSRLKRVFEVRLYDDRGGEQTRYVLAKSVGWGWLGYHAFHAAVALVDFVPPVLGLRGGVLFSEWLPQDDPLALPRDRAELLRRAAGYVAARFRRLRLPADPVPQLDRRHQKGAELLARALSGAFGWRHAAALKRGRLVHDLSRRACPVPTLVDGKMRLQEWVRGPVSLLKTDFEQHGLGKTELNVTDPAYDLAEAILHLELSAAEEQELLERYRVASGDHGVEDRLFACKLLAGTAALHGALDNLRDTRLRHRHHEFNRGYVEAAAFLTAQTVRFCGRLCAPPAAPQWRSPLAVLDIDGVLDKQVFGFPSTTAAGIEALALLHSHGAAIALNSARTLAEVREYSRAYGCAGGVAEYGSVAWDAVTDRTEVLVTAESRDQLERLARSLRRMPGVFLNDRYQHSLRAYFFESGRTVPLPRPVVEGLAADLGLDRLRVHQTYLDTTVLAGEVDKGKGLLALLALAGVEGVETIAVGDSEPDLAMFRVATRSFAPRHISGRSVARLLGCQITGRSYQRGLLSAARAIVHPDGGRCPRCTPSRPPAGDALVWEMLQAADRSPAESLVRALADPMAIRAFLK